MRFPLPASVGDVVAYIGYLSLEGTLSPRSLPQYVSAVSIYHQLYGLDSPTNHVLIPSLIRAYTRRFDENATPVLIRFGCSAELVHLFLRTGLNSTKEVDVASCTAVVLAFLFQVRAVFIRHVCKKDIVVDDSGITATLFRRKGRSVQRPLIICYPRSPDWEPAHSIALVDKWLAMAHSGPAFPMPLSDALQRVLLLSGTQPPSGCTYSAHSLRISGYNELLGVQFTEEFLMRRLDWDSEAMLRVYFDSRICFTNHSRWFFAHLRP